uniref:Uncharacterized protein n=1 Tax=Leersia perrieri TaxID=77586 RepID=A0A0D9XQM3_9ORYZ
MELYCRPSSSSMQPPDETCPGFSSAALRARSSYVVWQVKVMEPLRYTELIIAG